MRRTVAWAVMAAVGALLCGTAWALSSPVGSAPDDNFHLPSIWCADPDNTHDCTRGRNRDGVLLVTVPALVALPDCYKFNTYISGDCQDPLHGDALTPRVNQGSYPGGFYRVMHLFVSEHVALSVVMMRLVSVLLAVLLFTALAVAGTRATRRLHAYVLACGLVPLGWFILASNNPSSWGLTGVTAYAFALHSLFIVRKRWQMVTNGVLAVAGTAVGVSARGDAAIYVMLVTAAVGILHWRHLRANPRLLVVPAVCCLLGVLSILSAGQVSDMAGAGPETDRTRAVVIVQILLEFPSLLGGVFGFVWGLGWLDTVMPSLTTLPMLLVIGFLLLYGASRGSRSKTAAVLVLAGALVAMPISTLYRTRLVPGEGVQARYLLPLMPALLALVLTARKPWRTLRLTRVQAWIVWAFVSVANAAALYSNLRRYVTGYDDPVVIDHEEWWWQGLPSPYLIWALGTIGFAAFAFSIVLVSPRRRTEPTARERRSSIPRHLVRTRERRSA